MTIHLINYADWRFRIVHKHDQERQIASATKGGINKIHAWNRQLLVKTDFYKENKHILNEERGAGFWLWNPFLINRYLRNLNPNDVLIYADCDMPFIGPIHKLIKVCEANNGLLYFKNSIYNIRYTKRYCFQAMGCDTPEYHYTTQICGGFAIVKRNAFTLRFYKEFLELCCNKKLIDDDNYGVENYKEFIGHRHPVSILTNLYKKYNLNAFCAPIDPDLFFERFGSADLDYEQVFNEEEKKHNFTYLGENILGGQLCSIKHKRVFAEKKEKAKRMKQKGVQWKKDHKKGFILIPPS